MYPTKEEPRRFPTGCYICPVKKTEVELDADVPRAWVQWPVQVVCKACGQPHLLEYEQVHQCSPIFGRE